MRIHVLSEETINQIAAGEVIENPASVVKELVENAVDAGAAHIRIETWGGGFLRLRISDDGMGMSQEDAVLCLERHATSKIGSADDLFSLDTMGFRGEALASIAAISKMTLLTATESAGATCVEVEGGRILHVEPAARARGTTIEVRSLFYNVPARKKFQKSAPVSTAEITKVITQLSLAHPCVGFSLIHQDREVFSLEASQSCPLAEGMVHRCGIVLGEDFSKHVMKIESSHMRCTLAGVIGSPVIHRHHRTGQYLFVNQRPVVCPLISYAIRDAYATRLPSDRHPIYALHVTIPAHLVDVNVHPQKKEIRLREEKEVRSGIYNAVSKALQGGEFPECHESIPAMWNFPLEAASAFHASPPKNFPEFPLRMQEVSEEKTPELFAWTPTLSVVGVMSHYLILDGSATLLPGKEQEEPGLILVNLKAAAARIAYDEMVRHQNKGVASQGLLIPLTVELTVAEASLVEGHCQAFRALGFEIRPCGKQTVLVDALPAFIESNEVAQCVHELLDTLATCEKQRSSEENRLRDMARAASRFARMHQSRFSPSEAEALYRKLILSSSPYYCPYGKPMISVLNQSAIEALF
jgi:DNA mismatch repair protein MutL